MGRKKELSLCKQRAFPEYYLGKVLRSSPQRVVPQTALEKAVGSFVWIPFWFPACNLFGKNLGKCTSGQLAELAKMYYNICPIRGKSVSFTEIEGEIAMALEKELETYKSKLSELISEEGKFVLIKGDEVCDTFTSYEDALKEGYKRFGLEPFLVKQILATEQVQFITRLLDSPCPT